MAQQINGGPPAESKKSRPKKESLGAVIGKPPFSAPPQDKEKDPQQGRPNREINYSIGFVGKFYSRRWLKTSHGNGGTYLEVRR
jgi:hypothetical protein